MRVSRIAGVLAVSAGMLAAMERTTADEPKGATLAALRIAYQHEVDAIRRYRDYAARAESEGYLGTRDLFAALGRGEKVHARMHATWLARMGVKPAARVSSWTVEGTAENLRVAFASELEERRLVYGRFTALARAEGLDEVGATFRCAGDAEATHGLALADAYFRLTEMRRPRAYFVCKGCGALRSEPSTERCACGEAVAALEEPPVRRALASLGSGW